MSSARAALDEWCARVDELLDDVAGGSSTPARGDRPVVPLAHPERRSWSTNGVFSDRAA